MKRIFTVFTIIIITLFALYACSAPKGGMQNDNFTNDAPLSVKNLNGLRSVLNPINREWGYALVAGDCIFTDEGYYKFEDVIEYNIAASGAKLGAREERDIYFARGENSVYGIYRAGKSAYYAFSVNYSEPAVRFKLFAVAEAGNVSVGSGGSENSAIIYFGNDLVAYDFTEMEVLGKTAVSYGTVYDFNFFQKENSAVAFTESETVIYTFYPALKEFGTVTLNGNFSDAEMPAVINGVYFFGGGEGSYVSLEGKGVSPSAVSGYEKYRAVSDEGKVLYGEYSALVENGEAVLQKNGEAVKRFTVRQIAEEVPEIAAIVGERGEDGTEIVSVRFGYGKLFIILEKKPDVPFVGLRNVNDGIPQTVVSYNPETGVTAFCGLIDFTWFNIYRIIEL